MGFARRFTRVGAVCAGAAIVAASCGSDSKANDVTVAQKRVESAQQNVADAQKNYDSATKSFCNDTKAYITAIDRYGKLFSDDAATVGDLKTVGADLVHPRTAVTSSAHDVAAQRDELAAAKGDLAAAQASLAAAQAAATGGSTSTSPAASSTTTTTLVPPATIDRVQKAEADFTAATQGVNDQTRLTDAAVEVNSAAFALEAAWLHLFADAECFTDEQEQQAEQVLYDYTVALQTALESLGYYTAEIDGVYGPGTIEAVKKLQTSSNLPVTGYVDQATALALNSATLSKGGVAATQVMVQVTAVQTALKLAGYWTGPIDGKWTQALTDALKKFQTDLGVPVTGAVDSATMAAFESAIADAKAAANATTTVAPNTTSAAPTTNLAPTTTVAGTKSAP